MPGPRLRDLVADDDLRLNYHGPLEVLRDYTVLVNMTWEPDEFWLGEDR